VQDHIIVVKCYHCMSPNIWMYLWGTSQSSWEPSSCCGWGDVQLEAGARGSGHQQSHAIEPSGAWGNSSARSQSRTPVARAESQRPAPDVGGPSQTPALGAWGQSKMPEASTWAGVRWWWPEQVTRAYSGGQSSMPEPTSFNYKC